MSEAYESMAALRRIPEDWWCEHDGQREVLDYEKVAAALTWQPIETAPRDGTRFLGCTDKGATQIIKLNKHLQIWILDDGKESWREMTYWMPIQATPPIKS